MIKQKVYLLPENLYQLSNLNIDLNVRIRRNIGFVSTLILYVVTLLLQLILPLKPDFNSCNKLQGHHQCSLKLGSK